MSLDTGVDRHLSPATTLPPCERYSAHERSERESHWNELIPRMIGQFEKIVPAEERNNLRFPVASVDVTHLSEEREMIIKAAEGWECTVERCCPDKEPLTPGEIFWVLVSKKLPGREKGHS